MIYRQRVKGRTVVLVLGAASAATLLAACSSTTAGPTPQAPASAPANIEQPDSGPSQAAEDTISTASLTGHVHNLLLDRDSIYLGTHDGLWSQKPGQQPERVTAEVFDVMGLARTGTTWLASGHPGPDMQAPSDLGLGLSTDGGRTWKMDSLRGQVDFHRLVADGSIVMGIASADGVLWRTEDLGRTWKQLGTPPLFDLAMAPGNTSIVIGTTQQGLIRSTNGGASFTSQPAEAPLLALLSATDSGIYGAGTDGNIYFSADDGLTWTPRGNLAAQPTALASLNEKVVALVGDVVVESNDGGRTFVDRLAINNHSA
ncbi:MAG: hypothetical protein PHN51_05055 [Candidatus Nanopelagicales bacterium]|nr:hypothetical protein [Candidatus Nanopelagicales bacterium]